jgi:DNA-binding NarL/FixJ family response regulator
MIHKRDGRTRRTEWGVISIARTLPRDETGFEMRQETAMTLTPSTSPTPTEPDREPEVRARPRIRVLIVDDHPAVRLGARALIDAQPDLCVVAEARSVRDALSRLDTTIDVAVVDYHLRDGHDGLALVAHLRRRRPAPRTLVYSAFADAALAVAAIIAGADGLLGKHELGDELCDAIRRVASGRRHLPAIAPAVVHAASARIEPQDRPIFGMLIHGVAPGTIAGRLAISPEQLAIRRVAMLRSLTRTRREPVLPSADTVPLDYERPKRRSSLGVGLS